MPYFLRIGLFVTVFLACSSAKPQSTKDYIIAARRMGTIEFIDPASLQTLSRITAYVPPQSTGLDGVFLNPDGHTLYLEGPIGADSPAANNCCWLYAIDLATLQAKKVAGIWGTESRRGFVSDGPGLLRPVSDSANQTPVVDQPRRVPLPKSPESSKCTTPAFTNNFTIETHLFVYEGFGGKIDRRRRCTNVIAGAWMLDATTHRVIAHLASDFYFWQLVPNYNGSELYGITSEGPNNQRSTGLVRIDSETGKALQYRVLENDYWFVTAGRLALLPSGDLSLMR